MSVDTLPARIDTASAARPPRVWLGAVMVALFWAAYLGTYAVEMPTFIRFAGRTAAAILLPPALALWWWLRRGVPRRERWTGFLIATLLVVPAVALVHPSIGGFGVIVGGLPMVLSAGMIWLLVSRRATSRIRQIGLVAALVVAWGGFLSIRTDGLDGDQRAAAHWRWTPTAEERFLADKKPPTVAPVDAAPLTLGPDDWPGFRGPHRDSVVRGVTIRTDWTATPPKPLWRTPVGPGWSSMAVVGRRLFTQEQRGEREAIVAYDAATGTEVWVHENPARFYDPVAGAGPRATPAFADGRLFCLGGSGLLNCLDAATGREYWSRDAAAEAGAKAPTWGFCSSPLVYDGLVIVYTGGTKGLLAYRAATGEPAWSADAGTVGYGSPQFAVVAGVPAVLFFGDRGLCAFDPSTGATLWEHEIALPGAPRSIQPHVFGGSQILVSSEVDLGTAALDVTHAGTTWSINRRWTSRDLKPSFNDYVIHEGHAYGFDGSLFTCIDLASGKRRWKGGRYGHGQVVLLADQALLLVVSETGDIVLVNADPQQHRELGRVAAVCGKTWGHPAVAGGRLFVRSGEEMACFELATLATTSGSR
ncbi:MAG: PQQ-binding-like beta-propeller repeat protein [Gemmataceae bacterium]